jgi:hypothetical protein
MEFSINYQFQIRPRLIGGAYVHVKWFRIYTSAESLLKREVSVILLTMHKTVSPVFGHANYFLAGRTFSSMK